MEMSGQLYALATLAQPWGKNPQYQLDRRLGGSPPPVDKMHFMVLED
jgi:hypothetical protein